MTPLHRYLFFVIIMTLFGLIFNIGEIKGADKIQDNSFLIEEAYNQEDGVIQHIQTFQYLQKSKTWGYLFTQEWPVPGQTHQFSYTIPVNHLEDSVKETGIGDIAINYRYQLIFKEPIAMSPRLSLLLH